LGNGLFTIGVFVQAIWLNSIVNNARITPSENYITAILFILVHFLFVDFDVFSPIFLANFFLLFALASSGSQGRRGPGMTKVFNIGLAIGLAVLCYNSYFVLLFWALSSLVLTRVAKPVEYIVLLMGFFCPLFLFWTGHFLNDTASLWWTDSVWVHFSNWTHHASLSSGLLFFVVFISSVWLITVLRLGSIQFKISSEGQKGLLIVFLLPMFLLLSFLFQSDIYAIHYGIFIVPTAILLSLTFQSIRKELFAELLHLVLFLAMLGIQYGGAIFGE
jgi:hypothetical protein